MGSQIRKLLAVSQTKLKLFHPPLNDGPRTGSRSLLLHYLTYLAVRLFVCLVQSLSYATGVRIAAMLAVLIYRLDRRHREVARENLRRAFPGRYSEKDLSGLILATYRHFCTMLVEISHLPRK